MSRFSYAVIFALLLASPVRADPPCGAVEFRFQPAVASMQLAVWVEDAAGQVVDTPYITRATGQFGIGNRPGAALLKTDCGWPYGRREMVLPIWAHHRNHHYPLVVMGGGCGNSVASLCPMGGMCGGDCSDTTIAYHSKVSSPESYFCAPVGCVAGGVPDVVTCASVSTSRTLSKGAYADPTAKSVYSLYPPRSDLTTFTIADSADARDFANKNDIAAVSQATPKAHQPITPALFWNPQSLAPGDYVAWIEMSQLGDFNQSHNHPNAVDTEGTWTGQGHTFLGQPSIVYKVGFHYDRSAFSQVTSAYAGYSTWDGSDGTLHPPDGTISDQPGTGAGRLADMSDGTDNFRFKVLVGACGTTDGGMPPTCVPPPPVTNLSVTAIATGLRVSFQAPGTPPMPNRYVVRYVSGAQEVNAESFKTMLIGPELTTEARGAMLSGSIDSLMPDSPYTVAVESVASCGLSSPPVSVATRTTVLQFTVLHGCFIATAAYGTPLDSRLTALRRFRDARLFPNPLGQLAVATYYSFSPSVASAIATSESLRALTRSAITPVISLVEKLERTEASGR